MKLSTKIWPKALPRDGAVAIARFTILGLEGVPGSYWKKLIREGLEAMQRAWTGLPTFAVTGVHSHGSKWYYKLEIKQETDEGIFQVAVPIRWSKLMKLSKNFRVIFSDLPQNIEIPRYWSSASDDTAARARFTEIDTFWRNLVLWLQGNYPESAYNLLTREPVRVLVQGQTWDDWRMAILSSELPPTQAVAVHDFPAEQDGDLELTRGMVVNLIETKGNWWRGSVAEKPEVVGNFPKTHVSRGLKEGAAKRLSFGVSNILV